ncbi:MAG TPA: glycosyl transferase family protein [Candidatus Tenderia sp.]|nr:glycosyl transferase family protein [Candidatus Tenderia sp.]
MSSQHPFAPFVRILGRGRHASRSLTQAEAYDAMSMILQDDVEPVQLGAFLMLIRAREETPEEVAGFVRAVQDSIEVPPQAAAADLDWSSYAGKKRQLPWFILSTLLLAANGTRVFMHGTSGHTAGRIYTRETLAALGIPSADTFSTACKQLNDTHFTYLDLEHLSPRLHQLIELRPLLGLRTPIHTVARMLNPLRAPHVMQGIFHPGYLNIHQEAGRLLQLPHLAVIKGDGGEIERNPDISCRLHTVHESHASEEELPALFSKRHVKPDTLDVKQLLNVWRGTAEDEYGTGAVTGTLAIALRLMDTSISDKEALEKARTLWDERDKQLL